MLQKLNFSVLAAALLLAGCASKPLPDTEKRVAMQTITSTNQSQLIVESWEDIETSISRPTDTQLRYVTQGDTSKTAALKTLQFVALAFAGGGQVNGFSKEDLKGTQVPGVMNPSITYLTPRVSDIMKNEMDRQPMRKYNSPLIIKPTTWKLMYKNLAGGDDNYTLVMKTTLSRNATDKTGKDNYMFMECVSTETTPEYTLPQWQANNYAKVNEVTQQVLDSCLAKFTTKANAFL
ncbi:Uncharacterised protein [Cedecea neteri]|uniref:Lipoprotein n=1 Tax=Cedecea neteri TaxID=158822 RepID=A0A291E2C6_9ENTR|nr:hypothetical protein [Cedecea neteri]ATF93988.1 hypothetical protein CO704_18690 [Cedecea neteri]SQA97203.1 Uncharacterised protein [Cedecea neteri]